jgi:hypothetical protein
MSDKDKLVTVVLDYDANEFSDATITFPTYRGVVGAATQASDMDGVEEVQVLKGAQAFNIRFTDYYNTSPEAVKKLIMKILGELGLTLKDQIRVKKTNG